MPDRVTAYMQSPNGSRSFGVTVRGLRVLVTADEGQHDEGRSLASAIALLGPECTDEPAPPPPPEPAPPPERPRPNRNFTVGQRVRCNVHGAEGECTITDVGTGRNRGRVKVTGERMWCPAVNFDPCQDIVGPAQERECDDDRMY